jgi:hypothetical protein
MKIDKVLDFRSYHSINEGEETKASTTADQIVNLFFQAYTSLVTKIGDYKDAVKDLTDVAEADPADKGTQMLAVINKIAAKVDPKYKSAAGQIQQAAKKLSEIYAEVSKTEDGKKQLSEISKRIYKMILSYIESLKTTAAEAPKIEDMKESRGFNLEEQSHFYLLEKNTFTDEREELVKKITPIYSNVRNLFNNSPSDELKGKCKEIAKKLKDMYALLKDEEKWKDMKRRERKDELARILDEINKIPEELNQIQSKTLIKLGVDQKLTKALQAVAEMIAKALEVLNKEEETVIAKEAGEGDAKDGDKGEDKKEEKEEEDKETYEDFKQGGENESKKGKNREGIKKAQEKMNSLLPEKSKIVADGLYGKNTAIAIKKIADTYSSLAPELLKGVDGKVMTAGFQKFLSKLDKNKGKISDMFK